MSSEIFQSFLTRWGGDRVGPLKGKGHMKPIKNKFIIIAALGCLHFLLTIFVVFHAYPLVFESNFPDAESIEAAQFWAGLWDVVVAPLGWLEAPLKSTPLANYTRWLFLSQSFLACCATCI